MLLGEQRRELASRSESTFPMESRKPFWWILPYSTALYSRDALACHHVPTRNHHPTVRTQTPSRAVENMILDTLLSPRWARIPEGVLPAPHGWTQQPDKAAVPAPGVILLSQEAWDRDVQWWPGQQGSHVCQLFDELVSHTGETATMWRADLV
jgi:hypothetical protein